MLSSANSGSGTGVIESLLIRTLALATASAAFWAFEMCSPGLNTLLPLLTASAYFETLTQKPWVVPEYLSVRTFTLAWGGLSAG